MCVCVLTNPAVNVYTFARPTAVPTRYPPLEQHRRQGYSTTILADDSATRGDTRTIAGQRTGSHFSTPSRTSSATVQHRLQPRVLVKGSPPRSTPPPTDDIADFSDDVADFSDEDLDSDGAPDDEHNFACWSTMQVMVKEAEARPPPSSPTLGLCIEKETRYVRGDGLPGLRVTVQGEVYELTTTTAANGCNQVEFLCTSTPYAPGRPLAGPPYKTSTRAVQFWLNDLVANGKVDNPRRWGSFLYTIFGL